MEEKQIKKIIKNEIVPYLIGLRNEVAESKGNTFIIDDKEIKVKQEKGDKGDTPIADKDYPSKKTVEQWVKDSIPKKGIEYFTETDIKEMTLDIFKMLPTKEELKGKDGVVDYDKVKILIDSKTEAKYKQIKTEIKEITDTLLIEISKNKAQIITAEQIIEMLRNVKGKWLKAEAIIGLDKYMQTFIVQGGSGGSVVAEWGRITGDITDQTDLTTYLGTNYVPYSGATGSVDLGTFDLTAQNVHANGSLIGTFLATDNITAHDNSEIVVGNTLNMYDQNIHSVGYLGIGTISPLARLHVSGPLGVSGEKSSIKLTNTSGVTTWHIGAGLPGIVNDAFFIGRVGASFNTPDFFINNNAALGSLGNVGVGTRYTTEKLTVNGNIMLSAANIGEGIKGNNFSGTESWSLTRQNAVLNNSLSITSFGGLGLTAGSNTAAASAYHMYINSSGNVGIGTIVPYNKLAVAVPVPSNGMTLGFPTGVGLGSVSADAKYGLFFGVSGTGYSWMQSGRIDGTATAYNLTLQGAGGNVGIGTLTPSQALDLIGSLELEPTKASTQGVIYKGTTAFIHDFSHPTGQTIAPIGRNLFIGGAGNFTTGSTATQNYQGSNNVGIGLQSMQAVTLGFWNTGVGATTLGSLTTGRSNMALGLSALFFTTTGSFNSAIGVNALRNVTTGEYNIGIGTDAGAYLGNGTTVNAPTQSLYIGGLTKALASGGTNEIVIGYNATGVGSNSVVLGNDSITKTILKGNVGIGTTAPSYPLQVNGGISGLEKSADPTEPAEGEYVIWMSDGTGKGDDGDVLIASKAGGTTKWTTLFDHSAGSAW